MAINAEEIADLICNECGIIRVHKTKTILDKSEMLIIYAYIHKLKVELDKDRQASIVDAAKEIAAEVFKHKP